MLRLRKLGFTLQSRDMSYGKTTQYFHVLDTPLTFFDGSYSQIFIVETKNKKVDSVEISDDGVVVALLEKYDIGSKENQTEINLFLERFGAHFKKFDQFEVSELRMPLDKKNLAGSVAKYFRLLSAINAFILFKVAKGNAKNIKNLLMIG